MPSTERRDHDYGYGYGYGYGSGYGPGSECGGGQPLRGSTPVQVTAADPSTDLLISKTSVHIKSWDQSLMMALDEDLEAEEMQIQIAVFTLTFTSDIAMRFEVRSVSCPTKPTPLRGGGHVDRFCPHALSAPHPRCALCSQPTTVCNIPPTTPPCLHSFPRLM